MSESSKDWIIIGAFFASFVLVTTGEIYWLTRKLLVPAKKALTIVFLSNFLTITLGFFVSFILFGLLLAVTSGQSSETPRDAAGTTIAFVSALGFPVLLMGTTRRLLIAGLRIAEIPRPVPYAIASTLIFFAAVFGIPAIFLTLR